MHLPWIHHRRLGEKDTPALAVDDARPEPSAWEIAEAKRHALIEEASRRRDVRYSAIPRRPPL